MRDRGWMLFLSYGERLRVRFARTDQFAEFTAGVETWAPEYHCDVPEAICRAALAAEAGEEDAEKDAP